MDARTAARPVAVRRHGLQAILKECEDVRITKVFRPSTFYRAQLKIHLPDEKEEPELRDVSVLLTKYPSPDFVEDGTKPKMNYMLLIYTHDNSTFDPLHQAFVLEQNYLVGQKRVVLTEKMLQWSVASSDNEKALPATRIEFEEIEESNGKRN
jgi:hypothetical protein